MEIDFVVTWVDMNEPTWQEAFKKNSGRIDNTRNQFSAARFRDQGLLKYWFRGAEKFAPWVRRIHFVTCGQKPSWLSPSHPKLRFVNHEDYIPSEFLPSFNSNVIESYMHNIKGLTEHFVYFNDDCFIIDHTEPQRFFSNRLPNDIAAFRLNLGMSLWNHCLRNNIRLINERFSKKEVFGRDHAKWLHKTYKQKARLTRLTTRYPRFLELRTPHNAQPYCKQTFREVWEYMEKELTLMAANRFRTRGDYTLELFRTWQICQTRFSPYNTYRDTKMFPLLLGSSRAIRAVRSQAFSLVCLNDSVFIPCYEKTMQKIRDAFEEILPQKSSFEI